MIDGLSPLPTIPVSRPLTACERWTQKFQLWRGQAYAQVYGQVRLGFDDQLADETVTDALVGAWEQGVRQPDYFQSSAHFCNWVKMTAVWRATDALRRRTRHHPLPEVGRGGEERVEAGSFSGYRMPRARASEEEAERQQVWDCLGRLPEKERVILSSYYYDRSTDVEVGGRLFGSAGTARARGLRARRARFRALTHFRRLLLRQGVGRV